MAKGFCKKCDDPYENKGLMIAGYCKFCAGRRIEQLQTENEKMANALRWWIKVNKGAPNKRAWAEEALEGK